MSELTDTDLTTGDTPEHFKDRFNFSVVETASGRVGVGVEAIDGHLLTGEEGGSRVGRVGDERVEAVPQSVSTLNRLL